MEKPTMAVKKFLNQVAKLLSNAEKRKRKDQQGYLEEAVVRLQAHQAELEASLAEEQSKKARNKLTKQVKSVTATREKGEKILQAMETQA
jgi:hypothetical protein